jgi:N-acetylglucosaminyldiphosphoundecaprenol N-acetyl-beta-D-mannosaminyltransferase
VQSEQSNRTPFLGLAFDTVDNVAVADAILRTCRQVAFAYLVTPNVDHMVMLHRRKPDDVLWAAYREADMCLCDSRILQALARRSGAELPLVTGSDLTLGLLERLADRADLSLAVVGGDAALERALAQRYPGLRWIHHVPPMGVLANKAAQDEIVAFVERTKADLTFFAIGAPQSELLCHRIALAGNARGVALCTGASLEFVTGAKRRAPLLLQRLKLEWLFRLLSEPTRLWRRYLIEGPAIFRIWYRWHRQSSPRRPAAYESTGPYE